MKNLYPLLFLLLSTYTLVAQKEAGTWSMDLYVAPQYFDYVSSSIFSSDSYDPLVSYSIGLALDYRMNKRWAINTGLVFQNGREYLNWTNLRWGSQHNGNGGFDPTIPSGEPERKSIREEFHLEIPITAKYYFSTGNKRLYCRIGIQPEWLIGIRSVTKGSSATKTKRTSFDVPHWFNASTVLGIGLELDLGKRLSIFAEPEWKNNFFRGNAFFDSRKYLLGLRVGGTWQISGGK